MPNLNRRHLTESQRGMIAVELANMEQGRQLKVPDGAFTKINDAATALNVSPSTVCHAKKVKDSGNAA